MKQLCMCSLAVVLAALLCPKPVAGQVFHQRETLKGVKGVYLLVENIGPAEDGGVSKATIEANTTSRLKQLGVPLVKKEDWMAAILTGSYAYATLDLEVGYLPVNNSHGKVCVAFTVSLEMFEEIHLSRDSREVDAVTWKHDRLVTCPILEGPGAVSDAVKQAVEAFAADWLAENLPPTKAQATRDRSIPGSRPPTTHQPVDLSSAESLVGPPANPPSPADAVPRVATAKAKQAVVFIKCKPAHGPTKSGTGFFVNAMGDIVTCWHVVDPGPRPPKGKLWSAKLWIRNSLGQTHTGSLVYADPPYDLAVVSCGGPVPAWLPLAQAAPEQADKVLALGYPLGQSLGKEMAVTEGIVSALRMGGGVIQIDAAVNPGMSGGPVLSLSGDAVGVAAARIPGYEGLGFVISGQAARQRLHIRADDPTQTIKPIDLFGSFVYDGKIKPDRSFSYGPVK